MANFEITEDLLTGIDDVDTQHCMLLELANDIVDTADEERGGAFFERTSTFLKEYVAYLFASEEMVMLEHKYPKFEAHRQHHASIGVELEKLVLKARTKGFTKELNAQYCFFVEDVLVQHIRTFDREMATFFRARNIKVSQLPDRAAPQSGSQQTGRTSPNPSARPLSAQRPTASPQVNYVPSASLRILVVEDDKTSRFLLRKMLEPFGSCDIAVNGSKAVEAFQQAHDSGEPYALVCLDVMMPEMDGQTALKALRAQEEFRAIPPSQAAKIVMTSALRDIDNVTNAYRDHCDGYLAKPIVRDKLIALLMEFGLLTAREDHPKS